MPVCVDCERWSPGTFRRCPDCAGVLKLEPLWARSSKDPQLARLDEEAKWWHRRARDKGSADITDAEAWAMVEDRRRRYEELRRRLLPVLELEEDRRVELMEAGARAAGLSFRTYEANYAKVEREREQASKRTSSDLFRALNDGQITHEEYDRNMAEMWAQAGTVRAQTVKEAARVQGLSLRAYQARLGNLRRQREQLWGGEDAWLTDPGGWGQVWFATFLALPVTGVVGLLLGVVFLLVGRSPLVAIAGTVVFGLAGWVLAQLVFFGTLAVLDRLAPRSWIIRRVGEPIFSAAFLGIFIVPPVLVILAAFRLG
jgi:hypothetical protein